MSTPEIMALYQELKELKVPSLTFEVKGKKKTLTLDKALTAAIKRVGVDRVKKALEKTKAYYLDSGASWMDIKKQSYEELVSIDMKCYLEDMSAHEAHKGALENTVSKVAKDYGFTVSFVKWYMKEKGISEQQITCEHDDQDQYADDGQFYNSVGKCKKCLMETNDSFDHNENIELLYKAWNRK